MSLDPTEVSKEHVYHRFDEPQASYKTFTVEEISGGLRVRGIIQPLRDIRTMATPPLALSRAQSRKSPMPNHGGPMWKHPYDDSQMFSRDYSPLDISVECLPFQVAKWLSSDLDSNGGWKTVAREFDEGSSLIPGGTSPTMSLLVHLQTKGTSIGDLLRGLQRANNTNAYRILSEYVKGMCDFSPSASSEDTRPKTRARMLRSNPAHYIHERAKELIQIRSAVSSLRRQYSEGIIAVILTGDPGSGKSVLASQFARLYYESVLISQPMAIVSTIDATSLHTVNNTLTVLALNLFPDSDFVRMCSEVENAERKVELLFGAVRKRLRLLPNWLLIFDGFSEKVRDEIRSHWPEPGSADWGNGTILITSQKTISCKRHTTHMDLGKNGMEEDDAVELTMRLSNISDRQKCLKAAQEIGYYPLALSSAAMSVQLRKESTWQSFMKELRDFDSIEGPSYSRQMLASSVSLADALVSKSDLLRLVFLLLGCLAPEPLPLNCVSKFAKTSFPNIDDILLENELKSCPSLHLSSSDTSLVKFISSHEVFHVVFTRRFDTWLRSSSRDDFIGNVLRALNESYEDADNCDDVEKRYTLRRAHQTHFEHATSKMTVSSSSFEETLAESYKNLSDIHDLTGNAHKRLEYLETAVRHYENVYGLKRGPLAPVLLELGCALADVNRREESLVALEECLRLRRRNEAPSRAIARTLFSLSLVHLDLSNYDKALELLSECLHIRRQIFPKWNMHIGATLTVMARAYLDLGCYDESKALIDEALKIKERSAGKNSPTYATSLIQLGRYYLSGSEREDVEEALRCIEECVRIRVHFLGERHDLVLMAKATLGRAFYHLGDYEKSISVLQGVLDNCNEADKDCHSIVLLNLANSLLKRNGEGDLQRAEALADRALSLRVNQLGEDHYEVGFVYHTRAAIHALRNEREKARECLRETIRLWGERNEDELKAIWGTVYDLFPGEEVTFLTVAKTSGMKRKLQEGMKAVAKKRKKESNLRGSLELEGDIISLDLQLGDSCSLLIGPEGGELQFSSIDCSLYVPEGALSRPQLITIAIYSPDTQKLPRRGSTLLDFIALQPDGLRFSKPVTLKFFNPFSVDESRPLTIDFLHADKTKGESRFASFAALTEVSTNASIRSSHGSIRLEEKGRMIVMELSEFCGKGAVCSGWLELYAIPFAPETIVQDEDSFSVRLVVCSKDSKIVKKVTKRQVKDGFVLKKSSPLSIEFDCENEEGLTIREDGCSSGWKMNFTNVTFDYRKLSTFIQLARDPPELEGRVSKTSGGRFSGKKVYVDWSLNARRLSAEVYVIEDDAFGDEKSFGLSTLRKYSLSSSIDLSQDDVANEICTVAKLVRSKSEGKEAFMRGFEIPNFVVQLLVECPGISETKVSMIEKQLDITKSTQPYLIDTHALRLHHDLQDWIMKHGREATLEKLFEAFWKAEIWGYMKNRLLDAAT